MVLIIVHFIKYCFKFTIFLYFFIIIYNNNLFSCENANIGQIIIQNDYFINCKIQLIAQRTVN